FNDDDEIDTEFPARLNFALNGAVHYAQIFAERTGKRVFAIGVAGSEAHNDVTIAFVAREAKPKLLESIDTFTNFAPDAIEEYYRVAVRGELPQEEKDVRAVRKVAASLHEAM